MCELLCPSRLVHEMQHDVNSMKELTNRHRRRHQSWLSTEMSHAKSTNYRLGQQVGLCAVENDLAHVRHSQQRDIQHGWGVTGWSQGPHVVTPSHCVQNHCSILKYIHPQWTTTASNGCVTPTAVSYSRVKATTTIKDGTNHLEKSELSSLCAMKLLSTVVKNVMVLTSHYGIYQSLWYLPVTMVFISHHGIYQSWYLPVIMVFTSHYGIYQSLRYLLVMVFTSHW